jgi:ribulose bisphosphate carboxylase small subunit
VTAEQFYVQCETTSQILKDEQIVEQVKNILLSTHWIGNEAQYTHQLEKLYELLEVAKPTEAKIGQEPKHSQSSDSEFTYQGL